MFYNEGNWPFASGMSINFKSKLLTVSFVVKKLATSTFLFWLMHLEQEIIGLCYSLIEIGEHSKNVSCENTRKKNTVTF